jgi:hypothetical protein
MLAHTQMQSGRHCRSRHPLEQAAAARWAAILHASAGGPEPAVVHLGLLARGLTDVAWEVLSRIVAVGRAASSGAGISHPGQSTSDGSPYAATPCTYACNRIMDSKVRRRMLRVLCRLVPFAHPGIGTLRLATNGPATGAGAAGAAHSPAAASAASGTAQVRVGLLLELLRPPGGASAKYPSVLRGVEERAACLRCLGVAVGGCVAPSSSSLSPEHCSSSSSSSGCRGPDAPVTGITGESAWIDAETLHRFVDMVRPE